MDFRLKHTIKYLQILFDTFIFRCCLIHIWYLVFTFYFSSTKGKVQSMQNIVSEHEQYLDALRDFNDWLISAKEELQRWSDLSGDSMSIKRKLSKVQVRNCYT